MVRPYAMKGHKRKRKEEKYDRKDTDQSTEEETVLTTEKQEIEIVTDQQNQTEDMHDLAGFPIQPYDQKSQTGAIFILEKASLEVAKVGKNYQLLNSDDHANFLKRNNRNPAEYRPDIAHQAILAILDSPLNKAGKLGALYVKTEKGVLFEVKPHVRIPRTYKRFSGIMCKLQLILPQSTFMVTLAIWLSCSTIFQFWNSILPFSCFVILLAIISVQLLQKLSITAVGKREKLLRVIKNPVTQYLPINSRKIGFSFSSEKLFDIQDYVATVGDDVNFVFVVGTMAHGKIEKEYVDDYISISGYPMSAAGCISRICGGLERKWKIL